MVEDSDEVLEVYSLNPEPELFRVYRGHAAFRSIVWHPLGLRLLAGFGNGDVLTLNMMSDNIQKVRYGFTNQQGEADVIFRGMRFNW